MTATAGLESAVRSYARSFPVTFATACKEYLITADGTRYLDFLAGAGTLSYGHNPEYAKRALLDYLERDGVTHGLDLATTAKQDFLQTFRSHVLQPRGMDHRVQFCSPSGTNAVEAALKIARLVTGRTNVVAFAGGFHGVSTGALAAAGSGFYKQGLYATLPGTTHIPYPVSPLGDFDSIGLLDRLVRDPGSGVEKPAAVLVESVQCEGGVYVAPTGFLSALRAWCDTHKVLLIVDDIQAGCGRTGTFFSFEPEGVEPDLVALSKAISGYGMPMALLLIKPEYDVWKPGQHSGTFRGNQLAFVTATATLRRFWSPHARQAFTAGIRHKGELIGRFLRQSVAARLPVEVRGTGLVWGVDLGGTGLNGSKVSRRCFERGLVVETCGRDGEVLKILPPLTIAESSLELGLDIILESLYDDTPGYETDGGRVAPAYGRDKTPTA